MGKMRKITLGIIMLVGVSPVSKAETAKEIKANQYTKCASSFVTTGAIKAAFNQQSDSESQNLMYGGGVMALYAGYLTSPEYALNSYKEYQQKIKQDSLKYISNGSRNEIYKFTVSYLVPKNTKCDPVFREFLSIAAKKDVDWDAFKNSEQAKKLMEGVVQSTKEMIVGKGSN